MGPRSKSAIFHPIGVTLNGEVVECHVLGKTRVEFGRHSLVQMEIRGLSKQDVLDTLKCPTETGLPADMFRLRIRRKISRLKAIDVVYEERDDRILVITAYPKDLAKK